MNKVVTIHLHGTAFQLEEAAYDVLRAYLDDAAAKLAANPDKDEIIADIEQAVADKCRAVLSPHKNVVLHREAEQIVADLGPVDDGSGSAAAGGASAAGAASTAGSASGTAASPPPVRRLYRICEGAMISGVCNGLAAYFGVDSMAVRAGFVTVAVLSLFLSSVVFAAVVLVYLALALLIPSARTTAEKAAAQGAPSTAQEFIRRAREGYYHAARTWGDKHAHRAWKRQFRQEMRAWKTQFRADLARPSATWAPPSSCPPSGAGTHPHPDWPLWVGAPFAGLVKAALTILAILAIVSLLMSGRLFTFGLPQGVPVWLAIVLVIVVYQIAAAPFHALRHACRHGGWYSPHPLAALLSASASALALCLLVFSLWYLNRHVPEAHEFFRKVLSALHALFDSIRAWWSGL